MTEKDPNRGNVPMCVRVGVFQKDGVWERITEADKDVWNDVYDAVESDVLRKQEEKRRFTKPSRMDVYEYMAEKHVNDYETESEKFFDFYSSKGWFVGKNKMKDWAKTGPDWIFICQKDTSGQEDYCWTEEFMEAAKNNKEEFKQKHREWKEKNRDYYNQYLREKYKNNEKHKI